MELKDLLKLMVERDASDLFLKVSTPPRLRIDGKIFPTELPALDSVGLDKIADELMSYAQKGVFKRDKEVDFAIDVPQLGRFRVCCFFQRSSTELVFRRIRKDIQNFEGLNLPAKVFEKLSLESRGMILLCGATGSGKSTAIASMIEYINNNCAKHILTIEDPVEFVFEDKKSIITQRELGFDTPSYESALKHSVYQSPDVLFIGNIRDSFTMYAALMAAECGQLLLSTLHAISSAEAIERMVNFFPAHQHDEIRLVLSSLLKGIISLRLIARKDKPGRIPAYEVMIVSPTIEELIREGKTSEIRKYIEDGELLGMATFEERLVKLCKEGKISVEDARANADNLPALELALSGLKRIREER